MSIQVEQGGPGRKRKERSTYKGPGGLACLSLGMLSVAGNRKLK